MREALSRCEETVVLRAVGRQRLPAHTQRGRLHWPVRVTNPPSWARVSMRHPESPPLLTCTPLFTSLEHAPLEWSKHLESRLLRLRSAPAPMTLRDQNGARHSRLPDADLTGSRLALHFTNYDVKWLRYLTTLPLSRPSSYCPIIIVSKLPLY